MTIGSEEQQVSRAKGPIKETPAKTKDDLQRSVNRHEGVPTSNQPDVVAVEVGPCNMQPSMHLCSLGREIKQERNNIPTNQGLLVTKGEPLKSPNIPSGSNLLEP